MGKIQRIWEIITGKTEHAEFIDESPKESNVSVKDLLNFMEKQGSQQAQLIAAVLETSASQARTMETYIELFKPREVKSTTLEEREANRSKVHVRDSEFEKVKTWNDFEKITGDGIPPDPSEW